MREAATTQGQAPGAVPLRYPRLAMTLRTSCRKCGAASEGGRSIVHRPDCEAYQVPAASWPGPVEPQCPAVCPFRLTWATSTQAGILTPWQGGRIPEPPPLPFYHPPPPHPPQITPPPPPPP